MRIERLPGNPIIRPNMDARMGSNIAGPSLIRVPEWVERALGRYYLYFADHKGSYIRLAYADRLEGPWSTYEPGTLQLHESCFPTTPSAPPSEGTPRTLGETDPHIASPDVHVDDDRREIRMYYHGLLEDGRQVTRVALSPDGLHFEARPEILGHPYFRVFEFGGWHYALAMPGIFYRSRDGLSAFEQGPILFNRNIRHVALKLDGTTLSVFHTMVGDVPERVLLSTIDVSGDWGAWAASPATVILEPETDYEGAGLPLEPSVRGPVHGPVRQLRDPAIYQEGDATYLLYSVAGESGIAIARLVG